MKPRGDPPGLFACHVVASYGAQAVWGLTANSPNGSGVCDTLLAPLAFPLQVLMFAVGRLDGLAAPRSMLLVFAVYGVLFVMTYAIRAHRSRQQTRAVPGLCTHCGYDLRASKDRCPECGTPITSNIEETA